MVKDRIQSYAGDAQVSKRNVGVGTKPQGAVQVTLYSTSWCGYCRQARQHFAKRGVRYDERDVEASAAARREYHQLGARGVPVILVGRQRMDGFDAARMDRLLKAEGL